MAHRRLQRLAALTQGLALVGLGVSAAACNNDPPHVNSPAPDAPLPANDASALTPTTTVDAGAMPPTVNSPPMSSAPSDAGLEFRPPHTVNAPPPPKGFKPPPPPSAKP